MTSERKANVWKALKTAQESLEAVGKGSQNQYHGYNYTSAEDMLKACRKALHDAGLVAIRKAWWIKEDGSSAMVESHFVVLLQVWRVMRTPLKPWWFTPLFPAMVARSTRR